MVEHSPKILASGEKATTTMLRYDNRLLSVNLEEEKSTVTKTKPRTPATGSTIVVAAATTRKQFSSATPPTRQQQHNQMKMYHHVDSSRSSESSNTKWR